MLSWRSSWFAPPLWRSNEAPYSSSPSLVEGQVSGATLRNTTSYTISIVTSSTFSLCAFLSVNVSSLTRRFYCGWKYILKAPLFKTCSCPIERPWKSQLKTSILQFFKVFVKAEEIRVAKGIHQNLKISIPPSSVNFGKNWKYFWHKLLPNRTKFFLKIATSIMNNYLNLIWI